MYARLICFLTLLSVAQASTRAEDIDDLTAKLEAFDRMARKVGNDCSFVSSTVVQHIDVGEDFPLIVESVGRVSARDGGRQLRFDSKRNQEGLNVLTTFESGLRSRRKVLKMFDVKPKGVVREIVDTPPGKQFDQPYYGLNPCYWVFGSFLNLRLGSTFDSDSIVPLRVLESKQVGPGRIEYKYECAVHGGLGYTKVVFENEDIFLPISTQQYFHPLVMEEGLSALRSRLEELDLSNRDDWVQSRKALAKWEQVGEKLYVPSVVRMVRNGSRSKSDCVFRFRQWSVPSDDQTPDLFSLTKFAEGGQASAEDFRKWEKLFEREAGDGETGDERSN